MYELTQNNCCIVAILYLSFSTFRFKCVYHEYLDDDYVRATPFMYVLHPLSLVTQRRCRSFTRTAHYLISIALQCDLLDALNVSQCIHGGALLLLLYLRAKTLSVTTSLNRDLSFRPLCTIFVTTKSRLSAAQSTFLPSETLSLDSRLLSMLD